MRVRVPVGLLFLAVTTSTLRAQFTEQVVTPPLAPIAHGTISWGDYDNDGDLDLLIVGSGQALVYANQGGGIFTEQPAVRMVRALNSSATWGDYDNDGWLDVLLVADTLPDYKSTTLVFHNTATVPTHLRVIAHAFAPMRLGALAWGDFDNDGDLDALTAGDTTSSVAPGVVQHGIVRLYAHLTGDEFKEQPAIAAPDLRGYGVAWGDYDRDGDLDLLLSGEDTQGGSNGPGRLARIYRNEGGVPIHFAQAPPLLPAIAGDAHWGDYDSDGKLDILLAGHTPAGVASKILHNLGGGAFTEVLPPPLPGMSGACADWGDFDNDGDLDIVLSGAAVGAAGIRLHRNDGGNTFAAIVTGLPALSNCSVAWGDYDNDGDLDFVIAGFSGTGAAARPTTKLYRNDAVVHNTAPTPPHDLRALVDGHNVSFSWSDGADAQTIHPAGLTYNLVIGTTPQSSNRLSGMVDRTTGYRRVVALGNTNHQRDWRILGFDGGLWGKTYYWSVQSIDNAFAGSAFAPTQKFWMPGRFSFPFPWPGAWALGTLAVFALGITMLVRRGRLYRRPAAPPV